VTNTAPSAGAVTLLSLGWICWNSPVGLSRTIFQPNRKVPYFSSATESGSESPSSALRTP
jgi:hypothetical protein